MRRNRNSKVKKERIIMIASSAFVLAALTMTGVYMKENNAKSMDDGYSMDFAALEDSAEHKLQEIARNVQQDTDEGLTAQNGKSTEAEKTNVAQGSSVQGALGELGNPEDDLDYMPLEVGSGLVEIPGLTDGKYTMEQEEPSGKESTEEESVEEESAEEEVSAQNIIISDKLHFAQEDGLSRPTAGEVLMHYSMDGSVYFETLEQYKYNPAVMFSAEEGSEVTACADGKVVDIYEDAQIGHAVTLDLGDGYQATYGQLKDIQVTLGSYVEDGEAIGAVAAPTKYFTVEGSNLYFQLTKDGNPVNPENLF